eukprot:1947079-Pyramimonas_sp.AAC.1
MHYANGWSGLPPHVGGVVEGRFRHMCVPSRRRPSARDKVRSVSNGPCLINPKVKVYKIKI